jgi:cupin 2 domain-containing protein
VTNIYDIPETLLASQPEWLETICSGRSARIERIISKGHVSEPDHWYDQEHNEWVLLLQGKASLEFENGHLMHLQKGDHLLIKAGHRHRVSYTSKDPECIWLAVHFE